MYQYRKYEERDTYDIFPYCVVEVNLILEGILYRLVGKQFTNVLYVPHLSVVTISVRKSQHMFRREKFAVPVTHHRWNGTANADNDTDNLSLFTPLLLWRRQWCHNTPPRVLCARLLWVVFLFSFRLYI